jgi:hypothetical protein
MCICVCQNKIAWYINFTFLYCIYFHSALSLSFIAFFSFNICITVHSVYFSRNTGFIVENFSSFSVLMLDYITSFVLIVIVCHVSIFDCFIFS